MRAFSCQTCGSALYFENSVCMTCGSAVGYLRSQQQLVVLDPTTTPCLNLGLNGCNWIPDVAATECFSCSLTRTRPADDDAVGLPQYFEAEHAKRRLIYELDTLGLPVHPLDPDTGQGVCFDLLSSVAESVTIGHADGVITLDVAESDDAHREQIREEMGETYRTMLGHFRHEIGHYYEAALVEGTAWQRPVRERFGDDTHPYQAAIDRHYRQGPPAGWEEHFVSSYATMHPYEDFAESFAHVLHIRDTLETATAYGLAGDDGSGSALRDVITGEWLRLSLALNQVNRSLGHGDLYPFVLPPAVVEKMQLVDDVIRSAGAARAAA